MLTANPDRLGPYVVVSRLGRGGTGVVYAGVHEDTAERVALKVVHVERSRHRWLRREIAALSRLRHPQIVRVLDRGESHGLPWFAMELVEGPSLSRFTETQLGSGDSSQSETEITYFPDEAPGASSARAFQGLVQAAGGRLSDVLELVRKLCAPLAFLHGEGLVHRDLKPENVLIRSDGLPVLVDFGLASAFAARGRESLDLTGVRAGTPPYMAPEQIRGDPVDARADLYALGCILYEMLTGRPPFVGLREAVLRAHLSDAPAAPSTRVGGIPVALDALCLSLLEKDPQRRPGYALDIARAMGSMLGLANDARPGGGPRSYLYRPALTGRSSVVDRTLRHLGEGVGMVLLTGASGVGKTRIAEAVARRWADGGRMVVTATASSADPPMGPLRGVLRHLSRRREGGARSPLMDRLGAHGPVLARFEELLAERLPAFQPEEPPLPAKAEHLRVLRAMNHALDLLATRRQPLIVVDDLHWADPLTLDALVWAVQHDLKLRILATSRPEGMPAELEALVESGAIQAEALGPLDRADVGRMASSMLAAEQVSDSVTDWLSALSEGRPYAVSEALRLAVSSGLVRRDGSDWVLDDPDEERPGTVSELVEGRLRAVPAEARPVLHAAAVLGRDLTVTTLAALLGQDEDLAMGTVAPLLSLDILELRPSGALGWAHDRLWLEARKRIPRGERAEWHRKAAEALAKDHPSVVAGHLEAAGDRWGAAQAHAESGHRALEKSALAEADRWFTAAVSLVRPEDGVEGLQIALDHATRVLALRDTAKALPRLEEALPKARAGGNLRQVGQCLDALAKILMFSSDPARQLDVCEQALAVWRQVGDAVAAGVARQKLALALTDLGRRDEALRELRQALAELQALGVPVAEADCRSNLGLHILGDGRLEEAKVHYEAARVIAEAHGARPLLGRTLTNLAAIAWRQSDLDTAIAHLVEALAVHRATGARYAEGITLSNLAVAYAELGRHEEAHGLFTQSLAIDREVLNRRSEAWDLAAMAQSELALGWVEHARLHAREAVEVAREVPEPYVLAQVLHGWVRLQRQLDGRVLTPELDELVTVSEQAGRHGLAVRVLVERAQHGLASGDDVEELVREIRAAAEQSEDVEAREALLRLEAALDASEAGTAVHGEAPRFLPAPVRPSSPA